VENFFSSLRAIKKLHPDIMRDEIDLESFDTKTLSFEDKEILEKKLFHTIESIKIPYWYQVNPSLIMTSFKPLDSDLNNDEKHLFHYFMRLPLSHYLKLKHLLETLLKNEQAVGNKVGTQEIKRRKKSSIGKILFLISFISLGLGILIASTSNETFAYSFLYAFTSISLVVAFISSIIEIISYFFKKYEIPGMRETIEKKLKELHQVTRRPTPAHEKTIIKTIENASALPSSSNTKGGEIYRKAMTACDIDENELKSPPLFLKELAILQNPYISGYKQIAKTPYFKSLWLGKSGALAACYYLQYIFMLEDKIEVFTTFYDVIKNSSIGKKIDSFYYKDISKIAFRESELVLGQEIIIPVTTLEIVLESGEHLIFNIANESTNDFFSKQIGQLERVNDTTSTISDMEKNLELEIDYLKKERSAPNISEEEKTQIDKEIERLQALKTENTLKLTNEAMTETVDTFIIALKSHIHGKK